MIKTFTLQLEHLDELLEYVMNTFTNGVIVLKGDLAAGKTTFVKQMAKKLGIEEEVTSPTFSLQHCYGEKMYHYDMYNHGLEHFVSLGMLEELDKNGLHFVEWGDDELIEILLSAEIPTITIEIKKISDDSREYKICTY